MPSFSIYPDNSWRCYGCDKYGSNFIDFAGEILREHGIPEGEIFARIMEEYI